ncbi:MAG: 3,5-nucleoside bisphosphate phosphatase [Clostridiales bacterium]|nr:3,5-nucleoside bisphosphate phosphatase [Clostridiales bacterium]
MTPANIVAMAMLKGLDVIALTDHNSCKNCPPFLKLANEYGILGISGMELTTMEEVHVVCLFATLTDAMNFDQIVEKRLIPVKNRPDIFGKQQIMDEKEQVIGEVENLLINSTDISFDEVFDLVEDYHGVMIPAHIDKNANSLLANLGFVPPDSKFGCFELKNMESLHKLQQMNPYLCGCKVITNSDAHYLGDINEAENMIYVKEKTPDSILETLKRPID